MTTDNRYTLRKEERCKYTLPLDEWGDVTGHKKEYVPPPEIVTINNESFDISSLSEKGKKAIRQKIRGSLPSHEKVENIPIGTLYTYWKGNFDWDDYEDFLIQRKSKKLYSFESFCEIKERVLKALSTIGQPKEGEVIRPLANFSNGEVRALRALEKDKKISNIYLLFFFKTNPATFKNIIERRTYIDLI